MNFKLNEVMRVDFDHHMGVFLVWDRCHMISSVDLGVVFVIIGRFLILFVAGLLPLTT